VGWSQSLVPDRSTISVENWFFSVTMRSSGTFLSTEVEIIRSHGLMVKEMFEDAQTHLLV
jgi:hypothetical protein